MTESGCLRCRGTGTDPVPGKYTGLRVTCPRCGGSGIASNEVVKELPKPFGRPDDKITAMLDDVQALNVAGKIDSMVIITTSYGHEPQIRRRLGHTATTLLGALTNAQLSIAAEAHNVSLDDSGG